MIRNQRSISALSSLQFSTKPDEIGLLNLVNDNCGVQFNYNLLQTRIPNENENAERIPNFYHILNLLYNIECDSSNPTAILLWFTPSGPGQQRVFACNCHCTNPNPRLRLKILSKKNQGPSGRRGGFIKTFLHLFGERFNE